MNVENAAETELMEALKESLVVAVGYPRHRAVQHGGEYDDLIDDDLSALFQILAVPYSFLESAESAVCLGQYVVYFPVARFDVTVHPR